MIQILISAFLVLGLGLLFVVLLKSILRNKPTNIKAYFGNWFSIEANFQTKTNKTRS